MFIFLFLQSILIILYYYFVYYLNLQDFRLMYKYDLKITNNMFIGVLYGVGRMISMGLWSWKEVWAIVKDSRSSRGF